MRLSSILYLISAVIGFSSCVHEWPEADSTPRRLVLNVNHRLDWNPTYDLTVTRSDYSQYKARYHFKICQAGSNSKVLYESEHLRDDLTRADFSLPIELPPGDYELWTWSDWADYDNEKSVHFDSSDFTSICYSEPYKGNNDIRDALRGMTSFTIENTLDANYYKEVDLNLERPLAKYEFISTDLAEFIENESNKDGKSRSADELAGYKVKMIYTGYMPSEFDNFQNKPVNSKTGVTYDATITKLNDDEALLGFDYVMVNGHESSVPVAMEVYDPNGDLVGRSNAIDVPTQRNRLTTVRGKFLTSKASGGVGINPDFEGEFNIEIK